MKANDTTHAVMMIVWLLMKSRASVFVTCRDTLSKTAIMTSRKAMRIFVIDDSEENMDMSDECREKSPLWPIINR